MPVSSGSDWLRVVEDDRVGQLLSPIMTPLSRATRPSAPAKEIQEIRDKGMSQIADTGPGLKARVVLSVLCDLALQGWALRRKGGLTLIRPPSPVTDDPVREKERIRNGHLLERDSQLAEDATRRFITDMERQRFYKGQWVSIFSLMRDGKALSEQLAAGGQDCIAPYLQFVSPDAACPHTGLRLQDIWRYFRHTWTTVYHSTPGRQMAILIRDGAASHHPIIGIASLGSSVVQLGPRDQWIGWTPARVIHEMQEAPSNEWAVWIRDSLLGLVEAVYIEDLLKDRVVRSRELANPTEDTLKRLRLESREARNAHILHWRVGDHKSGRNAGQGVEWRARAQTYLFRSKRARALADALEIRMLLRCAGWRRATLGNVRRIAGSVEGRRAVKMLLRYVKASHAGVSMADITVCGAIDPYRALLGGKLVSLLMTSPEVVAAYESRYKASVSVIASAVAGKPVRRQPRLVLLGTTSLYGSSSSQYNRLSMKPVDLEERTRAVLEYALLGKTVGYGSYHFSKATMGEMEKLLRRAQGGRRINSIFGEGVNPKLRKVRSALGLVGLPADKLLRHGSARLIYGVPLATNFRDILLGLSTRPRYIFPKLAGRKGTTVIAQYWADRWLARRIQNPEILTAVAQHSTSFPVTHGARVRLPDTTRDSPLWGRK